MQPRVFPDTHNKQNHQLFTLSDLLSPSHHIFGIRDNKLLLLLDTVPREYELLLGMAPTPALTCIYLSTSTYASYRILANCLTPLIHDPFRTIGSNQ